MSLQSGELSSPCPQQAHARLIFTICKAYYHILLAQARFSLGYKKKVAKPNLQTFVSRNGGFEVFLYKQPSLN
jgi:hypothetical protein